MPLSRGAVIGYGGMGAMHARAVARHAGALVCCDPLPDRAADLARSLGATALTSVEEAIATGLDAAVVATPTDTHPAVVSALLAAGVPTFCEKPLAMTIEETAALGRVAD